MYMLSVTYQMFFEVATHLSFSKAADVLFVSQPAVSKQIKKLEDELGVPLFERNGNIIHLTAPGEKLYHYLHKAKAIERQLMSDVDIIKDQLMAKGELKIGASTTISLYVMPKVLSSFHRKFPQIKILLINRNSENVLNALVDREIDLAIIETRHQINAVHYQLFMQDEIIAVCARHSPYAKGDIQVADLKNIPLALRERGSGTLDVLRKKLQKNKITFKDLNIIARLGGTEALKNYLLEDGAVGFLSRLAVRKELENGTMREVNIINLQIERAFNFVIRNGEEHTGMIRSVIKEARAVYNPQL